MDASGRIREEKHKLLTPPRIWVGIFIYDIFKKKVCGFLIFFQTSQSWRSCFGRRYRFTSTVAWSSGSADGFCFCSTSLLPLFCPNGEVCVCQVAESSAPQHRWASRGRCGVCAPSKGPRTRRPRERRRESDSPKSANHASFFSAPRFRSIPQGVGRLQIPKVSTSIHRISGFVFLSFQSAQEIGK